jgi:GT2 family glycosyltransferase/glycosyltransferase involved in cell wall biosynthesis
LKSLAPDPLQADKKTILASGLFDVDYYRSRNPDVARAGADLLGHYVRHGWREGRRPSAAFDPQAYLKANPDIAALGIDPLLHWVQTGRAEGRRLVPDPPEPEKRDIRESGLFDAEYYLAGNPDVVRAELDPLDHYVTSGWREGRRPSAAFNALAYLEANPDVAAAGIDPLLHWIRRGHLEGRRLESDSQEAAKRAILESGLFDAEYYRYDNLDIVVAGVDPLDHYARQGWREGRRPSAEFNSPVYLKANPDIAAAGIDPLLHWIRVGRTEGRRLPPCYLNRADRPAALKKLRASGLFDDMFYLHQCPLVRDSNLDPLLHYVISGYKSFLEPSPEISMRSYIAAWPDAREIDYNPLLHFIDRDRAEGRTAFGKGELANWTKRDGEPALPDDFLHMERLAGVAFFSRFGFRFESGGASSYLSEAVEDLAVRDVQLKLEPLQPDVSIIIPVYGQLHFVLGCLDSLAAHRSRFSVEIVLVDDASPQASETWRLEAMPWIRYHRRSQNGGFGDACNEGVKAARGRFVVLLNSDVRVAQGWLDELIGSFELFPKAGLVGSKLFNADGSLQEAGGIFWQDGSAWNYGRDQDPNHPKYCFARQVDYVSGAAIALPIQVWRDFGGFDPAYRPAYCEDADLAFRLRERGLEVWFQPLSRVIHYEGKTHGRDLARGDKAHQIVNMDRLRDRWRTVLAAFRPNGQEPDKEANRRITARMLVFDWYTPTPDQDAGSFVTAKMLRAFQALGYQVTFVPLFNLSYDPTYTRMLQRLGIECLYAPFFQTTSDVLEYGDDADVVVVYRHYVGARIYDALREKLPRARIIFNNVDLHYLRERRQAELSGSRAGRIAAAITQAAELELIAKADCAIVHTSAEQAIIQEQLPGSSSNILVFPYVTEVHRSAVPFEARRDIMFLGGFAHSPNIDGARFFVSDIWPKLAPALPEDAKCLIVGASPTQSVKELANEKILVTGYVPDLKPYFDRARVFVVPLRYGAGIKGKLIESLAHGLPSIATSIAVEGMDVVSGRECIVADNAESFAGAVLKAYNEPNVWQGLQEAGYAFVEANYSWERCLQLCTEALDMADMTWLRRHAAKGRQELEAIVRANGEL